MYIHSVYTMYIYIYIYIYIHTYLLADAVQGYPSAGGRPPSSPPTPTRSVHDALGGGSAPA